ncbi:MULTISPECIES: hypothetical protein [unclassified Sinorhizobium]|uniref:hypothetical protein n=1 Tax=unclassified Sinorhizobium TaxID=2613772 RepID=UPI0024C3289E|nr:MULTISPECIES: hypothetical protein [unclassified Sinorhizobium]MDK1376506.1 hypothetical protein [Sinorhizobium sp. 6-70]MDK1481939.1 hypothetical protein [Sinorhizobium sp. 6-117]
MGHELDDAVIKTALMEVDDDLRGTLLTNRPLATSAVAIHVSLRLARFYRFRHPFGRVSLDHLVQEIIDGIWEVPATAIAKFAGADATLRACATDVMAGEVYKALRAAFDVEIVRNPHGGG